MTYFVDVLEFLAAVTRMLNQLPTNQHVYLSVELREKDTHRVLGAWSDEIAPDSWYYEEKK